LRRAAKSPAEVPPQFRALTVILLQLVARRPNVAVDSDQNATERGVHLAFPKQGAGSCCLRGAQHADNGSDPLRGYVRSAAS